MLSRTIAALIRRESAKRVAAGAEPEAAIREAIGIVEGWMDQVTILRRHRSDADAARLLVAVAKRA